MKILNKPVKIWNKLVTLSKAFKKSLGWRITYLTLNPPLPECRIFVFGAVPGGKVADRGPIVWEAANRGLRGVLGKKIARLRLRGVGKEDRGLRLRGVAVLGKKTKGKGFNFQTYR